MVLSGAGWWFTRHLASPPAPPSVSRKTQAAVPPAKPAIAISAQIRAQHTVAVPSPIGGNIDAFFADVNQEVAEGQLLARVGAAAVEAERENAARELSAARSKVAEMESQLVSLRLEASRARTEADRAQLELQLAEKTYRRQAGLNSQGATPRKVYEKALEAFNSQTQTYQAYADLAKQAENRVTELVDAITNAHKTADDKEKQAENADAALVASEVRAPVAGLIVARRGEAGKVIAPTEREDLFRIAVDLNLLEAAFLAPAGVAVNQPLTLTFPELGIPDITATVAAIRNGEAVIPFTSATPVLKPGMTCGIRVPLK